MTQDANDLLMSGGILGYKWVAIGDTVIGTIVEEPKVAQSTDTKTGEAQFWPSGDPKMNIVVILQTDLRDPADSTDDGKRRLYISSRMMPAVRDAVKRAGAKGIAVGGRIAARWVSGSGQGEGNAREYAADYAPPTVDPGSLLTATPAQVVAAAPLTAAPVATPVNGSLLSMAVPTPTANMAPPLGVDPAVWAVLPEAQRQAVLASLVNPAATAPPF
jgi:hypothetical protein